MRLDDVPKASGMWHVHGIDVNFVEKWCGRVDSGWEADLGGLADLAQVACPDIPFGVRLKGWPPEAIEEGVVSGVEAFVAQFVMSFVDECISHRGGGIELVATAVLLPPKSASGNEEAVGSVNEMSERISREVRGCTPGKEVLSDPLYLSIGLVGFIAGWKTSRCKVGVGNVGRLRGVGVVVRSGAEVGVVVVVVVDNDVIDVVVWCRAGGVSKEGSEAIGGMGCVSGNEVASVKSHREAAVAAWLGV